MTYKFERGVLGVRQVAVETRRDIDTLLELLHTNDVWKYLWDVPPSRELLNGLSKLRGLWQGRFIQRTVDDKNIGLWLLYTHELRSRGIIEADIALTDPSARGQGVAQRATSLLFDEFLAGRKCHSFYARIAVDNEKSLQLMRAVGIPEVGETMLERAGSGGQVAGRVFAIDLATWKKMRATIADDIGLPPLPNP